MNISRLLEMSKNLSEATQAGGGIRLPTVATLVLTESLTYFKKYNVGAA